MNQPSNYTVQYNIEHLNAPGELRKPEVIQIHFNTFDEAFRKLYTTDVHYFDKAAAEKSGLDTYVSAAMILQRDKTEPVVKVERSFDPTDKGQREHFNTHATLNLTKGDSFNLLNSDTRQLMREANPLVGRDNIYPLAVYNQDGSDLTSAGQRIKDALSDGPSRLQDLSGYAYSVDTHRHAFMNTVPTGAVNGVIVLERTPVPDIGTAAKTLLNVDLEIVDPLIAFNNNRHEFLTRMSVTDLKEDRSVIALKSYKLPQPDNDIQEAGLNLQYASRIHRMRTEEALPGIKRLSGDSGTLTVPVARYIDNSTAADQNAHFVAKPVNTLSFIDSPARNATPEIHHQRSSARILATPEKADLRSSMHQ